MIQLRFLLQSRFAWASLSTAVASASTVVYLAVIYGKPGAAEFIHLYSTITMLSAWIFSLLFFLPAYYPILLTRTANLGIYFGTIFLSMASTHWIFSQAISFYEILFAATLLSHILFIPKLGLLFRVSRFREAYSISIIVNFSFLVTALLAATYENISAIYLFTAGCLPLAFLIWFFHPALKIKEDKKTETTLPVIRGFLNPSLPILERTLWDQFLLLHFAKVEFTFWLYLISRIVSFSGTICFSYFTQKALEKDASSKLLRFMTVFVALLAILYLLSPFRLSLEGSLILGQSIGWICATALLLEFEKKSRTYFKVLGFWVFDFFIRAAVFYLGTQEQYALVNTASMVFCALLVFHPFFLLEKRPGT